MLPPAKLKMIRNTNPTTGIAKSTFNQKYVHGRAGYGGRGARKAGERADQRSAGAGGNEPCFTAFS